MSFAVPAEAYDRFMGRYSSPLAPVFADYAGIGGTARVLDVGCGTGLLTAELVARIGASSVKAVDPSGSFVAAVRQRHQQVAVQQATAEQLPFDEGTFDAAVAQLVVHFMGDPVAGLREMARVTRPGGVVAACVWDHAEGGGPLATFWEAARATDPDLPGEADLPGTRRGHLGALLDRAGLHAVEEGVLTVTVRHETFEEWWEPFTLGVGPAGAHVARLDAAGRQQLQGRCRGRLPPAPFAVTARAWTARGLA